MCNDKLCVCSLVPTPRNASEALRQATVWERAQTLFTKGGYDWYVSDRDPYLFGVCGPQGQHYGVRADKPACTCPFFADNKYCKHVLAVCASEECYDASLCKQYELTAHAEVLA